MNGEIIETQPKKKRTALWVVLGLIVFIIAMIIILIFIKIPTAPMKQGALFAPAPKAKVAGEGDTIVYPLPAASKK